jgi:hypothetical protein
MEKKTLELSYKEYMELKETGKKGHSLKGKLLLVNFICQDCGKKTQVSYRALINRNVYNIPICPTCCSVRTPSNSYKGAAFRTEEYRKKISKGVKKHRKENPEVVKRISEKLKTLWNTEERKEVQKKRSIELWKDPEYQKKWLEGKTNIKKLNYLGLPCDSIAEYAFLKFIENKCDKIERCDFGISYELKGEKKTYIPDFKITIGNKIIIYEIKGILKRKLEKNNDNFKKGFLNKDAINAKFEALKKYCKKKKWECRMLMLDNVDYRIIYRQTLKELKVKI